MKICKAIHSTFSEFANVTTIHGLAYVFDKTIKAIDTVFWFIAVCFGTGLAIYIEANWAIAAPTPTRLLCPIFSDFYLSSTRRISSFAKQMGEDFQLLTAFDWLL